MIALSGVRSSWLTTAEEAALGDVDLVGASRASANAARSAAASLVRPQHGHHRLGRIAGVGELEREVR